MEGRLDLGAEEPAIKFESGRCMAQRIVADGRAGGRDFFIPSVLPS
jgi:hypothetical protein